MLYNYFIMSYHPHLVLFIWNIIRHMRNVCWRHFGAGGSRQNASFFCPQNACPDKKAASGEHSPISRINEMCMCCIIFGWPLDLSVTAAPYTTQPPRGWTSRRECRKCRECRKDSEIITSSTSGLTSGFQNPFQHFRHPFRHPFQHFRHVPEVPGVVQIN